jgi:nucleotide-binding universal stress UspA family protein
MKRVLACIDASPRAAIVLERASTIAAATGAKLTLLRVVGLPHGTTLPAEALAMSPDELVELWRREAERDLEAVRATLPAGLVDSTTAKVGSPWSTIVATARELGADLIVIGSHGYAGIDHVLGTTAAKVVNHADRSVLVAR